MSRNRLDDVLRRKLGSSTSVSAPKINREERFEDKRVDRRYDERRYDDRDERRYDDNRRDRYDDRRDDRRYDERRYDDRRDDRRYDNRDDRRYDDRRRVEETRRDYEYKQQEAARFDDRRRTDDRRRDYEDKKVVKRAPEPVRYYEDESSSSEDVPIVQRKRKEQERPKTPVDDGRYPALSEDEFKAQSEPETKQEAEESNYEISHSPEFIHKDEPQNDEQIDRLDLDAELVDQSQTQEEQPPKRGKSGRTKGIPNKPKEQRKQEKLEREQQREEAEEKNGFPRKNVLDLIKSSGVSGMTGDVFDASIEVFDQVMDELLPRDSSIYIEDVYDHIRKTFKEAEKELVENPTIKRSSFVKYIERKARDRNTEFSKDTVDTIQLFTESYLVKILKFADMIATANKRSRVNAVDVSIALAIFSS